MASTGWADDCAQGGGGGCVTAVVSKISAKDDILPSSQARATIGYIVLKNQPTITYYSIISDLWYLKSLLHVLCHPKNFTPKIFYAQYKD